MESFQKFKNILLYEQSAEFNFCSLLVLENFDKNAYFLNEEKNSNFSLPQTVVKVGTLLIMILKNNDYKSCNQFAEVIAQCFLVNLIVQSGLIFIFSSSGF